MKITSETIKHLAKLSSLEFDDVQEQKFEKDFQKIVDYFELLNEVDTQNVSISNRLFDAKNDLRDDEIQPGLSIQDVIQNAPKSIGGAIVVPTVVEE